jgi:hypothetical protein
MTIKDCIAAQMEKCFMHSQVPSNARVSELILSNLGAPSSVKERSDKHLVVTLNFTDEPVDCELNLVKSLNGTNDICRSLAILN